MNRLSCNPIINYTNFNDFNYNIFNNYNGNNSHTKFYFNNFFRNSKCKCRCHCHCHLRSNQISYSKIDYQNQQKTNDEKKYDCMPLRNKSTNDLLYSVNKNTFDDIKNKYITNYNYHEIKDKYKKYDDNNIISLKKNKNNNIINNIKKIEINDCNNYNYKTNTYNTKNYKFNKFDIKPLKKSLYVKRKELTKYFHIIKPKKYSYGGKKLQTSTNKDNHQYKEVISTSYSKDKNAKKGRVINFTEFNNDNDNNNNNKKISSYKDKYKSESNTETSNNINNINKDNYNYLYVSCQNSPTNINRTTYLSQSQSKEGNIGGRTQPRIIRETYNTRLVDSKDLASSEKYLHTPNMDNKYRSYTNINSKTSSKIKSDVFDGNDINNKKIPSNKNFFGVNSYLNYKKNIPKSYSVSDLIDYKTTHLYNINNEHPNKNENENDYLNNLNDENRIDYEMIKLKVKLALLEKEKYEQQKSRNKISNNEKKKINNDYLKRKNYLEQFLNKSNKKPTITRDNTLLEKTKKLLEEKKAKNEKKDKNDIIAQSNSNTILYSLKHNLRDKNDCYNKNLIRPNITMINQKNDY